MKKVFRVTLASPGRGQFVYAFEADNWLSARMQARMALGRYDDTVVSIEEATAWKEVTDLEYLQIKGGSNVN